MALRILAPALLSAWCLFQTAYGLHIDIDVDLGTGRNVRQSSPSGSAGNRGPLTYKIEDYQVELNTGKYQGHLSDDGLYVKFSNIPYATPPNDNFTRFASPMPPDYHDGVADDTSVRKCPQAVPGWVGKAREFSKEFSRSDLSKDLDPKWKTPITPGDYGSQPDLGGDEDCLYLDVYVPKQVWDKRNEREFFKPATSVWIHGGGFVQGSKHDMGSPKGLFEATNSTEEQNIIFVSINYRLGMFGFFGGDKYQEDYGRANLGLLDQREALKWVWDSIYAFGGDSRRITAMGQGAGAASIMHQISGITYGNQRGAPYFTTAILQSPGYLPQPNSTIADAVYKKVLNITGAKDVDQLANVTAKKLQKINADMVFNSAYGQFTFGPTIDQYPYNRLPVDGFAQEAFYRGIPVMIGHTGFDGLTITPPWIRDADGLKKHFRTLYSGMHDETLKRIADKYPIPSDSKGGLAQRYQIASASTALRDLTVKCNVYAHSQALEGGDMREGSYRYVFNVDLAVDESDLNYVFYPESPVKSLSPFGLNSTLAKKMQTAWVNFIRYTDPNPENVEDWVLYKNDTRKVGVFGHQRSLRSSNDKGDYNFKIEDDPMDDDSRRLCDFWLQKPYYTPTSVESPRLVLQNEL